MCVTEPVFVVIKHFQLPICCELPQVRIIPAFIVGRDKAWISISVKSMGEGGGGTGTWLANEGQFDLTTNGE